MLRSFAKYVGESIYFSLLMWTTAMIGSILMMIILSICSGMWGGSPDPTGNAADTAQQVLNNIPLWRLLIVFWEDLVFVLPVLLLGRLEDRFSRFYPDLIPPKPLTTMLMIVSAGVFMCGHIYQGWISAIPHALYIPLAYWYARKKGITRTMTAHVIFDLFCIYVAPRIF